MPQDDREISLRVQFLLFPSGQCSCSGPQSQCPHAQTVCWKKHIVLVDIYRNVSAHVSGGGQVGLQELRLHGLEVDSCLILDHGYKPYLYLSY